MKSILVLGGLGYIGSNLVRYLLSYRHLKVTVMDRMDYDMDRVSIYELLRNRDFSLIKDDIRNIEVLTCAIKQADYVVNLAALVGEELCKKNPEDAISINEEAAISVADISTRKGKRLVHLSTASNYGQSSKPSMEDDKLYPVSLYAITKVHAEHYIIENSPNSVVLRCATAYGISPRMRYDLIVSQYIKEAITSKEIMVYSPNTHRPLVHIDDIASAIELAAEHERVNKVYNVGSNEQNFTKLQIAEKVAKVYGAKVTIDEKRSDPRDYIVDFSKIVRELGFNCKGDLETYIQDMAERKHSQEDMARAVNA